MAEITAGASTFQLCLSPTPGISGCRCSVLQNSTTFAMSLAAAYSTLDSTAGRMLTSESISAVLRCRIMSLVNWRWPTACGLFAPAPPHLHPWSASSYRLQARRCRCAHSACWSAPDRAGQRQGPNTFKRNTLKNSREKWRKWISLTGSPCWPSASANHRQTG